MYILVVDDDADIRDAIADFLRAAGYDVKTACHGRDALDVMAGARPALVVLDVNMPVMNGLECVAAIRADESLTTMPVIVVSADENAISLIAETTLHKPLAMDTLLALVRSALGA